MELTDLRNKLLIWTGALLLVILVFYGVDQFIMGIQGLPLNGNLTPAQ